MKLYHVSMDWSQTPKLFIPRIPESRAYDEDDVTERICLSTTIAGALSAIANKPTETCTWKKITVYELETDDYIDSLDLYMSGKVNDSILTHECWYLKPVVLNGRHMLLRNFSYSYEFIPNEKRKDEYISYAIYYLKEQGVDLSKKIMDDLNCCTLAEAMLEILPGIFDEHHLDLDSISCDLLCSTRVMYDLELKEA
ncbi:hypothetical protein DW886_15610 [Enterocloster aldenensis]|uniref:hypothetical protein n=1 Tax=Enterocloster aldenensis TaxID=358742 RepID=UPI000E4E94D8|nr:hypothetical protein DW886_15610 [Enterocloster aldenensis]